MTILEELTEYSRNCLKDLRISEDEDYISCKKHKWACRRFLSDMEKAGAEGCPYVWNEQEAQRIVDWFACLRHSKGVLAGKPIILTHWQKFTLCQLYGWRDRKTGFKRFHKVFIEVGRKNAKSQMMAGIMLYEISVTATKMREVYEAYTTGVKRDQSKIIFNECELMLRGSSLQPKFRVTKTEISHTKSGSFLKTLSKDDKKTGDGTNIAVLCIDEYHQHPTDEYLNLFLGANTKDPTLIIITTAGMDLSYPCYTVEYRHCSNILNPGMEEEDDEYLIDILEVEQDIPKDMEKLSDERVWWMANPIRMSYEDGRKKIRAAFREAYTVPEKMTAFLTKMMNIWVQARENGYMDMEKWRRCEITEDGIPIDLAGRPVYVGFDMSAKLDLTSVSFIIPYRDEGVTKYILFSHSFIPSREKLQEHIIKDKQPYDAWERMGLLTVTDTQVVDQNRVMQYVLDFCGKRKLEIQSLCFDPANASLLMLNLSNEGYNVEEVFQSHKSLNESTQGFREQVYEGNILHVRNPLHSFAMGNAVVRQNDGLIKIDKDKSTKRIDPVDADLCAYKLALYHSFDSSIVDAIDDWLSGDW